MNTFQFLLWQFLSIVNGKTRTAAVCWVFCCTKKRIFPKRSSREISVPTTPINLFVGDMLEISIRVERYFGGEVDLSYAGSAAVMTSPISGSST